MFAKGVTPRKGSISHSRNVQPSRAFTVATFYREFWFVIQSGMYTRGCTLVRDASFNGTYRIVIVTVRPLCLDDKNNMARSFARYRCISLQEIAQSPPLFLPSFPFPFSILSLYCLIFSQDHLQRSLPFLSRYSRIYRFTTTYRHRRLSRMDNRCFTEGKFHSSVKVSPNKVSRVSIVRSFAINSIRMLHRKLYRGSFVLCITINFGTSTIAFIDPSVYRSRSRSLRIRIAIPASLHV